MAARLAIPVEDFRAIGVTKAEWRTSSLGCPEAGKVYQPVIVAGYRVVLAHGGSEYVVHVGAGRAVLCSAAESAKRSSSPAASRSMVAADKVRAAIVARTAASSDAVHVTSTRPFRHDTPTCAAAPRDAAGAPVIVTATASGRSYRYYVDDERTIDCGAAAP